ncbi:MAG: iron donor protein CyaY [Burkholderiaceae bacterium]|nr:iron donor protein CyaY [Burkholderiaceae bacterium]
MTETEFLALAQATMQRIATVLEQQADDTDIDVECMFSGNVLEIEFIDRGSKIIVNSQAPMQQIWVAAISGGFHFGYRNGRWYDTRDDSELFVSLSRLVSEQAGVSLELAG